MINKGHIRHHKRRPPHSSIIIRSIAMAALAAACLALVGCSQERKTLAEIDSAYRAGEYREVVALCRHAVRRNVATPKVYYYYGASLLALDRDFEGYRELERAAQEDPELAREGGQLLLEAGKKDLARGSRSRAARRLQEAVRIDPALDLERNRFLVADEYFKDKEFERAALLYREAIERYPGDPECEQAYYNMAQAYAENEAYTDAREVLTELLALYPASEYKGEAQWKLATLNYEEADKAFVLGNYEEALELLNTVTTLTSNRGLLQKTRFLLGETYEAMGKFEQAYEQYRAVIDGDRGASGRIVERAREKIAAFREAGLY